MSAIKLCKLCAIPQGNEHKATFYDDVRVALGSWNGVEDAEDESIFFYMDGEQLEVGTIIAEDFIVVEIKESEVM